MALWGSFKYCHGSEDGRLYIGVFPFFNSIAALVF